MMKVYMLRIALVVLFASWKDNHVLSFEMGKLFSGFKVEGATGTPKSSLVKTKNELLDVMSFTNNGKDASLETQKNILKLVRYLETTAPVSDNLLTNPNEAKAVDGVWYLQYTSPSDLGLPETVRQ
jgi:hypothetical protein